MKITKTQLKKMIQEELSSVKEGGYAGHYDRETDEFTKYLIKMYQDLSETADVATIREIIQDNFNSALKAAENAFLGG